MFRVTRISELSTLILQNPYSILFISFGGKRNEPKKSHRRTCSAKNQLRSLKALKCQSFVSLTLSSQGTNAFLTLTPLIFLTHRSSVGTFCFPALSYDKLFPFHISITSRKRQLRLRRWAWKKSLNATLKTLGLAAWIVGSAIPESLVEWEDF